MSALKDRYVNPLDAAEIAKFSPEERDAYEDSLKYYRDMKNVVDTSREEGIAEGMEKGALSKAIAIARKMKQKGMPEDDIAAITGLNIGQVREL